MLFRSGLSGSYPIASLETLTSFDGRLDLSENSLTETIPNSSALCNLYLIGDAANCPNAYDEISGKYADGCCNEVKGGIDESTTA